MAGKNVLIVDDELNVRQLLQGMLRILGHSSQATASGEEALSKMGDCAFDLFLIDLNMPGMKGDDLARAIKQRQPGAVVIMITGSEPPAYLPELHGILLKPFSLAQLRDMIASVH